MRRPGVLTSPEWRVRPRAWGEGQDSRPLIGLLHLPRPFRTRRGGKRGDALLPSPAVGLPAGWLARSSPALLTRFGLTELGSRLC